MKKILTMLNTNLKNLNMLIDATTDPEMLAKHVAQRDEIIKEIGKEELREETEKAVEVEKAVQAEKDLKTAANKSHFNGQPKIEVGEPDNYKGVNIKAVVENINMFDVRPEIKARFEAAPGKSAGLIKHFADLLSVAETGQNVKAMQEGTDSEGGYLTPTEQRAELLGYIREMSVVAPDCTHISMNSDVMTIPKEVDKVTMAWTAEEADATDTTPSFGEVTLTAKRLDAKTISSNELIDDTNIPGGITAVLLSQFTEALGLEIDKQVLVGTGAPTSGIFTAAAGYSSVFASGSTAFSALTESHIRALIAQIPPERQAGAKFYAHNSVIWNYFYGLKDSDGRNLFIPSNVMTAPGQFFGFPAKASSQATSTSAAGATLAAFGNLKGFYIGDRLTNIKLMVDPYTLMGKNQTRFFMFTRWAFAHALNGYYGRIVTAGS